MNESTARRRHREANNGAEPAWAKLSFRNPGRRATRRLYVEEREAIKRKQAELAAQMALAVANPGRGGS